MKSILNKSAFVLSILVTAIIILNGCDVDHSLDPYKYGKVYMPQAINNPVEISAIFDFDTTQTVVYGAAYGGPKRPAVDISVSFSINASLVDSFNTIHLTEYPILPEESYTLSKKQAVIPSGKKSTSPLKLELKNKTDIPNGQYLLPVTIKITGNQDKESGKEFQVNEELQTTYFLINAHGFIDLPVDHNYAVVFSDHPREPTHLFFVGIPANKTKQWVWKYDINKDTLVTGFPKKITDVFSFPYSQIQTITSAGWYRGAPYTSLNLYGNGHFYHVLLQDGNGKAEVKKETGPLHSIEDLSDQPWPSNFPKQIDATMWISNRIRNFLFSGDVFGVTRVSAHNQWRNRTGTSGVGGPDTPWPGVPESFTQRGLSGCYYDFAAQKVRFFSGNEFIVYEIGAPASEGNRLGEVRKVTDYYNGL